MPCLLHLSTCVCVHGSVVCMCLCVSERYNYVMHVARPNLITLFPTRFMLIYKAKESPLFSRPSTLSSSPPSPLFHEIFTTSGSCSTPPLSEKQSDLCSCRLSFRAALIVIGIWNREKPYLTLQSSFLFSLLLIFVS